jgi:hypothetical protein
MRTEREQRDLDRRRDVIRRKELIAGIGRDTRVQREQQDHIRFLQQKWFLITALGSRIYFLQHVLLVSHSKLEFRVLSARLGRSRARVRAHSQVYFRANNSSGLEDFQA